MIVSFLAVLVGLIMQPCLVYCDKKKWLSFSISSDLVELQTNYHQAMKKTSGKRRKHTNKRKQHDSQPASLPPTSHSSQPDVGPLKENSLPPPVPPQSTSLASVAPTQQHSRPSAITHMSTSLPPSFPPLSTSLPSSFFSVPPCGPIQNNSTPSHGRSISLANNIVPTPRINSSSSCHISQKGSSSSLLPSSTQAVSPASSTPSISRSNIGGPVPASPSVISSSTTTPACAKTQYAGDIREYDAFHRLIITPDEDGFAPSYLGSRMVAESITLFFDDAWGRWKEFPYNIREQIWNQFKTKCVWQPCYENKINSIFEKNARIRVTEMLFVARKNNEKPSWLRADIWVKFLDKWNTPEFKVKCERAKIARASVKGGSLHTGGSMSYAAHKRKMTKLKGAEVSNSEVFEETHKKRNKDGTRGEWIEPRAEETFVGFQRGLDEWRQAHPTSDADSTSSSDITSIWTNVAGGVKKGRVYGLGAQPSSLHPSSLLSGASTSQSSEEMEAMRRQISELTERLQSSEANFAKVQKFMEKHMAESDESEGTDSDEE
ncbi:hypothetical protein KY285_014967 [Solanum tuberosum]|nr:hypothetical protein KY285_014967 [Solanum tuberosum]